MKTKKTKLTLNKRTVSNLEMKDVLGGFIPTSPPTDTTLPTWGPASCVTECYSIAPAFC